MSPQAKHPWIRVTVTAAGLILGFLLSTAYGAAFHLILGGSVRRMLLYLLAGWFGFALGHALGDWFHVEILKLGAINLLSASAGAWLALVGSWLLFRVERE